LGLRKKPRISAPFGAWALWRLPAGRHRVEIVRPGYRTEEREVEVRAGETAQLEVELERGSI